MKMNPARHNPDPYYLRRLIESKKHTQVSAAAAIGISPRAMRRYVSTDKSAYRPCPYAVQFMLEQLPKRD